MMKESIMSVFRSITAVAVSLAAAATLGAQGKPAPERITFQDAIALALKNNVAVRQAENSADLSNANVRQQKQLLLPDLRLNLSGSENVGRTFNQTEGAV